MENIVCKKVKIRDNGNCHVLIYDVDGPIKEDGVNQNCQNIREREEKLSCKPLLCCSQLYLDLPRESDLLERLIGDISTKDVDLWRIRVVNMATVTSDLCVCLCLCLCLCACVLVCLYACVLVCL